LAQAEKRLQAGLEEVAAAENRAEGLQHQLQNATHSALSVSILGGLRAAGDQLCQWPHQDLVATGAGLLGLMGLVHPPVFMEAITVSILAVGMGMAALSGAQSYWGSELSTWLGVGIFVEAGLITGLAAAVSFEGVQLLAGAALGVFGAHLASGWAMVSAWDAPRAITWYAACAALGTAALAVGQRGARIVLGLLAGGLMVASCAGFFAAAALSEGPAPHWLDAAAALLAVGQPGRIPAGPWGVARLLCLGLGAAVAALGATRWSGGWPALGRQGGQMGQRGQRGRGQLGRPLLEKGDSGAAARPARRAQSRGGILPPMPQPPSVGGSGIVRGRR